MKTSTFLATWALLCAPWAGAQEEKAAPPKDPKQRLESLEAEMKQIIDDWRAQASKQREEIEKARKEGKPIPAISMRPDFSKLVPKYEAAAKEYAGTSDAMPFLSWLLTSMADRDAAKRAAETIAKDHAASPEVLPLVPMFPYLERAIGKEGAEAFTRAIRAKNRHPDVLAAVLFTEHEDTIKNAELDSDEYKAARTALVAAAEKASDAEIKAKIQGAIDLREKLSSGSVAPDIAGVDLDGVAFKLSDYKGKVIFLDFWGDW